MNDNIFNNMQNRYLSYIKVWLAVFTTICVLVPSLFVMHKVSLRLRQMRDDKSATSTSHYKPVNATRFIIDIIQFIIGSLVQEGNFF